MEYDTASFLAPSGYHDRLVAVLLISFWSLKVQDIMTFQTLNGVNDENKKIWRLDKIYYQLNSKLFNVGGCYWLGLKTYIFLVANLHVQRTFNLRLHRARCPKFNIMNLSLILGYWLCSSVVEQRTASHRAWTSFLPENLSLHLFRSCSSLGLKMYTFPLEKFPSTKTFSLILHQTRCPKFNMIYFMVEHLLFYRLGRSSPGWCWSLTSSYKQESCHHVESKWGGPVRMRLGWSRKL